MHTLVNTSNFRDISLHKLVKVFNPKHISCTSLQKHPSIGTIITCRGCECECESNQHMHLPSNEPAEAFNCRHCHCSSWKQAITIQARNLSHCRLQHSPISTIEQLSKNNGLYFENVLSFMSNNYVAPCSCYSPNTLYLCLYSIIRFATDNRFLTNHYHPCSKMCAPN